MNTMKLSGAIYTGALTKNYVVHKELIIGKWLPCELA